MKPLVKPMKGWGFWLGSVYTHFNFARTWFWSEDKVKDGEKIRTSYWFDISSIHKEYKTEPVDVRCIRIIIGPFQIISGFNITRKVEK